MKVRMPDGTVITGVPDGTTQEELSARLGGDAKPKDEPKPVAAPAVSNDDSTLDFVTGNLNKGIASVAGLPVDATRNAMNLGIAGYGAAKHALGSNNLPELIKPGVGSSEWFEQQLRKAGAITPSADPSSAPGRYGAAALQMIPGALMGRGTLPQVPGRAAVGAASGLSSELARDIGGDEWAPVGAMAPGARHALWPPRPGDVARGERRADTISDGMTAGLKVPPATANRSEVNKIVEGVSGKSKLAQEASEINQPRFNDLALEDIGLPAGTKITRKTLDNAASQIYDDDYRSVVDHPSLQGKLVSTPAFAAKIDAIKKEAAALNKEFPNTVKDSGVIEMLNDFKKGQFTTDGTMKIISRLRRQASKNMMSTDQGAEELGRTQRRVTNELEELIGENLARRGGDPDLVERFKSARTRLAKINDVRNATDFETGDVSVAKLANSKSELSGNLKMMAEFGSTVPKASQNPNRFGSMVDADSAATREGMLVRGMHTVMAPVRRALLSSAYQKLMANPKAELSPDEAAVIRQFLASQVANQGPRPPQ